jgi:hypothetical protein
MFESCRADVTDLKSVSSPITCNEALIENEETKDGGGNRASDRTAFAGESHYHCSKLSAY